MLLFRFRAAERAGALLRLFDADGDGYLSFDEFRGTYQRLLSTSGVLGVTGRCFYVKHIFNSYSVTIAITLYVATAARQAEHWLVWHLARLAFLPTTQSLTNGREATGRRLVVTLKLMIKRR